MVILGGAANLSGMRQFSFIEEVFAPVWCATPSARGVGAGCGSGGPSSLPRAEGAGGGHGADCVNECGGEGGRGKRVKGRSLTAHSSLPGGPASSGVSMAPDELGIRWICIVRAESSRRANVGRKSSGVALGRAKCDNDHRTR